MHRVILRGVSGNFQVLMRGIHISFWGRKPILPETR